MDTTVAFLGLIEAQPAHGYDLKHRYDEYFGSARPLAFGQVYTTLARLVRDGLIELQGEEAGAGPDRKSYRILPAGRTRIRSWFGSPDSSSPSLQSNLFAKTVIALLLDEDADSVLDLQRGALLDQMRDLTRDKTRAPLLQVLLIDHALFQIEADLRWIDLASARLTEMKDHLR